MAYGDYSGPDKPTKGKPGGACNRQRCQAEPAIWFNHGSYSWYCSDCARDIGDDPVNRSDWARNFFPRLLHPQFETMAQMTARQSGAAPVSTQEPALTEPVLVPDAADVPVPESESGFEEDHTRIYGETYGDRSVKRSHRAEGRNYVD